jgi:ABC-type transport system involved in multi-copper enzyme maturation permease subunit
MRVLAIARNTFREAARDRVVHLLLVFSVILIVGSRILSPLALGEGVKITKDLGLSMMGLFGVLVVIFIGSSLVHKEVDRRTIYLVLSKPIRRWEFLLGKFAGMTATLGAVTGLMLVVLLLLLLATGAGYDGGIVVAAALIAAELTLMTAVALLFSTFTTPTLSAVFTLSLYIVGHLSGDLLDFARAVPNPVNRAFSEALYCLLPNLEMLNVRAEVVHGLALAPARVAGAFAYAALYTLFLLGAGSVVLSRRDFR